MRKTIFIFLCTLLTISSYCQTNNKDHEGIDWENATVFSKLVKMAGKEEKMIFVDVYATWCAPCKKMDKEVFSQKEVGDFIDQHYVSIQIQQDTGKKDSKLVTDRYKMASRLVKEYKITSFPTYLFFNSSGELVHKITGYTEKEAFLGIAKDILDPNKQFYTSIRKMERGELAAPEILKLDSIASVSKDKEAKKIIENYFLNQYLEKLPAEEILQYKNIVYAGSNYGSIQIPSKVFDVFLNEQKRIDSMVGCKSCAEAVARSIIFLKEFMPLLENKTEPLWEETGKRIATIYGANYVDQNMLQTKINWYRKVKNWGQYIKHAAKQINIALPDSVGCSDIGTIINYVNTAERVFVISEDKEEMESAIKWLDLVTKPCNQHIIFSIHEYKANLLYKLGRYEEALAVAETGMQIALKTERSEKERKKMTDYIDLIRKRVSYKELPSFIVLKPRYQ